MGCMISCACSFVALTQTLKKFYALRLILASFQERSLHFLKEDASSDNLLYGN